MKRTVVCVAALAAILTVGPAQAEEVGTAFTYQGQLKENGRLSSDDFDFKFTLWNAVAGGTTKAERNESKC